MRIISFSSFLTRIRLGRELIGTKDGHNKVYCTPESFLHTPPSITIAVYYNGVRLHYLVDYTVSESNTGAGYNTIVLTQPPMPEDFLTADYVSA
jgi:hypothetical protein